MDKPSCIMMVGLPGCGKSTRVKELAAMHPDVFVYSTDNLIEAWAKAQNRTYNDTFAEYISKATQEMDSMLETVTKEGTDVIWDQTNLGAKKRAKVISKMKQAGYEISCECFLPPDGSKQEKDWVDRLVNRPGKTIPNHILMSMGANYTLPTEEEGFTSSGICYFDMYGNIVNKKET